MKKKFEVGQVWVAYPNREADGIIFEIVGSIKTDCGMHWIAAKHMDEDAELFSRLEVNLVVVDESGHSVPSNLTFAPSLTWEFRRKVRSKPRYKAAA